MFEISLVPDVKAEMLRAQRIRNIVVFACFVLAIAAVVVILIVSAIKAGQDITMSQQDERLKALSSKINSFDDINELLTIQGQLDGLETISEQKILFSRVFSVVNVLLPTNGDEISLSELNVDIANSTLKFDAQADARVEPLIDYRVLDAFKKSVTLMKYDYGRYVDDKGNEIPVACIVETGEDGKTFEEEGSVYAIWARGIKGCDPERKDEENVENNGNNENGEENKKVQVLESEVREAVSAPESIKIYRTPRFEDWNKEGKITESGMISNVPHFESECITYKKTGDRWTSNNRCNLIPEEMIVSESSNARDSSGALVLRFSASVKYEPEVLLAKNKHMLALAPSGYSNVTDSYMQIQGMFKQRADDCAEDDAGCKVSQGRVEE